MRKRQGRIQKKNKGRQEPREIIDPAEEQKEDKRKSMEKEDKNRHYRVCRKRGKTPDP